MLLDVGIGFGGPVLKAGGLGIVHFSCANDDHSWVETLDVEFRLIKELPRRKGIV